MKKDNDGENLLTYCGLYCKACPSYHRGTCLGCRCEDHNQKRTSKWSCKIRRCCINERKVLFCGECLEFPCDKISKKLIESHPKDPRFYYRHEIPENMKELNRLGISKWIKRQQDKWTCENCKGTILFYEYACINCGKKYNSGYFKKEYKE